MRIEDVSKIRYVIKLSSRVNTVSNAKPIVGSIVPNTISSLPFYFYTDIVSKVGTTSFRSYAAMQTVLLMYKEKIEDDGSKTPMLVMLHNLPENFIKLVFNENYDSDTYIKLLLDSRLYNPQICCLDTNYKCATKSQIDEVTISHRFDDIIFRAVNEISNSHNANISNDDIYADLINKYAIFFLYDNIDDFNVFLNFNALVVSNCTRQGTDDILDYVWRNHYIFVRWRPDFSDGVAFHSLHTSQLNMTYNPFSTRYILNHIPMSLLPTYNETNAAGNYSNYNHISALITASPSIVWLYQCSEGFGYFNDLNSGNYGNSLVNIFRYMYVVDANNMPTDLYSFSNTDSRIYLYSYFYYLDYNYTNYESNPNDLYLRNKNLLGIGFIVRDTSTATDAQISSEDTQLGRFYITNSDGFFRMNKWLTALLRFLILRKFGFRPIAAFRYEYSSRVDSYKPISKYDRTNFIYSQLSSSLTKVRSYIDKMEYDHVIFNCTYSNNSYTFKVGTSTEELDVIELSENATTNYNIDSMIKNLNENIVMMKAVPDFASLLIGYLRYKAATSSSGIFNLVLSIPNLESLDSDPLFVTNNIGNPVIGHCFYYEYLSDDFPRYWYYDQSNTRIPNFPSLTNISGSVVSSMLRGNHPSVILYDHRNMEVPITKRAQKRKYIQLNDNSTLKERNIRYIHIYDYVNYSDSNIRNLLLQTQTEKTYPIDFSALSSANVYPPVIDIAYMYRNDASSFINGSLVASGDILRYPMLPTSVLPNNRKEAEIDLQSGLYYREVLYHKYIRYLILRSIFLYYYYEEEALRNLPDVRVLNAKTKIDSIQDNNLPNVSAIQKFLEIEIAFYDNRKISGENVEIQFIL